MLTYTNFLSNELPQEHPNLLFHFTTLDRANLILSNNQLRAGNLKSVNDIREAELYLDFLSLMGEETKISKMLNEECKILSFARNIISGKGIMKYGYKHPRMWAQYADNFKGCCLVIDENEFKKENPQKEYTHGYSIGDIRYVEVISDININCDEKEDVYKIIKKSPYKKIWFTKQKDWSCEKERRIVVFSKEDAFFNIQKSLRAIIFAQNIEEHVQIIYKLIKNDLISHVELYKLQNDNGHLGVIPGNLVLDGICNSFDKVLHYENDTRSGL